MGMIIRIIIFALIGFALGFIPFLILEGILGGIIAGVLGCASVVSWIISKFYGHKFLSVFIGFLDIFAIGIYLVIKLDLLKYLF